MSRPRAKVIVITLSRRDIAPLKRAAHALVHEQCALFASYYGVSYSKLSIGSARSRWGSCSRKGSLRFNYRIAALPSMLATYIIVHELCHIREFNHSAAFWELVARAVPEHKALRQQLRHTTFSFK